MFARRARLGAVPVLVRLAAAVHLRHRHPERHRGALAAPRLRAVPRLHCVAGVEALAARPACPSSTGCWRSSARSPAPTCCSSTANSRCDPGRRRRWTSSSRSPGSCCCSRRRAARSAGRWRCWRCCSSATRWAARTCPISLSHKGASVSRLMSHMWLTTEGVYGIALGVSTGTIFVYVLFGTLLDRAGGGNYMMQVSLRGARAPARRAGQGRGRLVGAERPHLRLVGVQRRFRRHLHHPADEEVGLRRRQGRAPSRRCPRVNGQITPPVMGAAAFLMVEYVGIPYSEIVKNAILPATLSYIGLFYIVHLEALKLRMQPLIRREPRSWTAALISTGLGISGTIVVMGVLYWVLEAAKRVMGDATPWVVGAIVLALYLFSRLGRVEEPRPAAGHRHRPPESSRDLAGGQGGSPLRAADRHADLVPDGRGDVAVALGVLGDRHADRADGDAAAADRFLPRHPDGRARGRAGSTTSCRASTTARAT